MKGKEQLKSKEYQKSKRKVVLSVLALVICVAMLLGTTLAWFTDSVTSGRNRIVAGDLDIDLLMDRDADGEDPYESIADVEGAIFGENSLVKYPTGDPRNNGILWEPGKTEVVYLAVQNLGTVALKYNIILDVEDEGLADALEYAIVPDLSSATPVTSWNEAKTAAQAAAEATGSALYGNVAAGSFRAAENGVLDEIAKDPSSAPETDYFALAVHMKEDAGNEYMEKDITIDVKVEATQMTAEKDSFDDQYDANIPIGGYSIEHTLSYFECTNPVSTIYPGTSVTLHYEKTYPYIITPKWAVEGAEYVVTKISEEEYEITISNPVADVAITDTGSCFAAGTGVTMADGTEKNIEDIVIGDEVLTFDHESGQYQAQKVYYNEKSQYPSQAMTITFEDGTELSLYMHYFFELESLKYTMIGPANVEECIGKHYYNSESGEYVALTDVTWSDEPVDFYSIYTEYNINSIANGMLSVPDDVGYQINFYEFNEDLRADPDALAADFEKYGICELPDRLSAYRDMYEANRWKYFNISVGKGLISWDDIERTLAGFLAGLYS